MRFIQELVQDLHESVNEMYQIRDPSLLHVCGFYGHHVYDSCEILHVCDRDAYEIRRVYVLYENDHECVRENGRENVHENDRVRDHDDVRFFP